MNLQAKLRALQDDRERTFRTLVRLMQRYRFLADPSRVLYQLKFLDQLVTFVLPLPTIRSWVRAFLDLRPGERVRSVARAGGIFRLTNIRPLRRHKPLLLAMEIHIRLSHSHAGNRTQLRIDLEQQIDILLDRNREGIDLVRRGPLRGDCFLRRESNITLLHPRRSLCNCHRVRRRVFHRGSAEIVGGGVSPGSISDHANSHTQ